MMGLFNYGSWSNREQNELPARTRHRQRTVGGKPFPASLPSSVRWRPVAAHRVRGSAGTPPCAAAVGAAQPVPPPLGPLACAVAVLPAPARLRHRTGEGPAPRRQEQRVPVTLLKKEKHRKSLCKTVAPLPGASPALPWVALPSSRPGLALVPVLASAGARAPRIGTARRNRL